MLTKKQKEEQRVAELRKQALLASGVKIEALQQQDTPASKKPVYGNRKKKGPTAAASSSTPTTRDHSPAASPAPAPAPDLPAEPEATPKADSVKDDWDASSEEEAPAAPEGIKESWDDSSEDEEEKPAGTWSRPFCQRDFVYMERQQMVAQLRQLFQPKRLLQLKQRKQSQPRQRQRNLRRRKQFPQRRKTQRMNRLRKRAHLKRILMTPTPTPTLSLTRDCQRGSRWSLRRKPKLQKEESRLMRLLLLPEAQRISVALSVAFLDTSIRARRSYWTRYVVVVSWSTTDSYGCRFVKPTFKKVKLAVSRSRSVQRISQLMPSKLRLQS